MRTNTIFTNVYNGSNIHMNMSGRRHIVHINNTEKHECYDLNTEYRMNMRYRDSKIQNYIIVLHATCLKIIFIRVKYKQINVMMCTNTTGHMKYCEYKDSLIQKLNTNKTCNIIFEKQAL